MRRHIPNAVSAIRVALAYPVASYALADDWLVAFTLYLLGELTDFLDGLLAKRLHAESEFGKKWVDPICDLALNLGAGFGLLQGPEKPWVLLGGIVLTVLVSALRLGKLKGSDWVRRNSEIASFTIYASTVVIFLNVYAYRALDWGITGIILTGPIAAICVVAKRDRISRVGSLGGR